jgi:predicted ATPase/DNA-binding SARP family transcriptional activator
MEECRFMKRLTLSLFGSLECFIDGQPFTGFRYDKVRALLALLATDAERPYRRDELAGLLWPDSPEEAARASLRQAIAILRDCLNDPQSPQPCLTVSRESIQWNSSADADVDVNTFNRLLQACARHPHRRPKDCKPCARWRSEALRLYRGDLLQGFFLPDSDVFEDWVITRREYLRRQATTASHALAEYHERRGEYGLAEEIVRRHLELELWDEESHRQLMRLLYLSDKRSQALAQYEQCRQVLSTELGVEPEPATISLFEQIRSGETPEPAIRASVSLPAERPHNLPPTITPFFGRDQELSRLAECFDNPNLRLISLIGAGGFGKTRLALQSATEQLDNFRDGVFFVPLDELSTDEGGAFAIANMLGINLAGQEEPLQQLVAYLADKELLLVLDSYEHLLPETNMLVKIIRGAPRVSILVTSRQKLNLRGELAINVNGLSLPESARNQAGEESEALALFAACGARARHGFELEESDRPYAAQICRMLDGMPLAIELAAAWLSMLSCRDLAEEIQQGAHILSGTLRDLPERQHSLRAIFDYTWDSLDPEEAALFRRLAVFRGGFDRQAAERVTGSSLLTLKSLLDKSLVRRNFRQGYEMHELARQYSGERMEEAGETEATRRKHLAYYLHLMETLSPRLETKEGPALLARLEDDHDNLRAAFDWALASGNLLECVRLAIAIYRMWYWHNHAAEAHRRLEALLAAVQAAGEQIPPELVAKVVYRAGVFASLVGEFDLAQRRLEEALHLNQQIGDRGEQAYALNSLGTIYYERNDFDQARRMFEEALAIDREFGMFEKLSVPLSNLAEVARVQGDYGAAQVYLEECLAIDRKAGNLAEVGIDLENLAALYRVQGNLVDARRNYLHSLELRQQVGSPEGIATCLEGLAMVAMLSEARAESGARLYGAAEALRKSIGMPLWESYKAEHLYFLESGQRAIGIEAWERAIEEGRQLGVEDAIRLARETK